MLGGEQWVNNVFDMGVDKDLIGDTNQRDRTIALWGSSLSFDIATARALLQTLGILRRRKQKKRKTRNQDFKAAPEWMISSGHIDSEKLCCDGVS